MKIRLISLFFIPFLLASCVALRGGDSSEEITQAIATIDSHGADFGLLISQMGNSSTYLIYKWIDWDIHSTLSGSIDRTWTEFLLSKNIKNVILIGEVPSIWRMTSSRYVFETKFWDVVILKDLNWGNFERWTQIWMVWLVLSEYSGYLILRKCNRDICKAK